MNAAADQNIQKEKTKASAEDKNCHVHHHSKQQLHTQGGAAAVFTVQ